MSDTELIKELTSALDRVLRFSVFDQRNRYSSRRYREDYEGYAELIGRARKHLTHGE